MSACLSSGRSSETAPTQQQMVAVARSWVGTPYKECAFEKGVGADCIGLLIGIAHESGFHNYTPPDWSDAFVQGCNAVPLDALLTGLQTFRVRLPFDWRQPEMIQPADVLIFQFRGVANHCGMATGEGTFIHSWDRDGVGEVYESQLSRFWLRRIEGVYRARAHLGDADGPHAVG